MKLGFENRKQTAFLGGLILLGGYLFYSNVLSGPSASPTGRTAVPPAADSALPPVIAPPAEPSSAARVQSSRSQSDEFRPMLHPKRPEDRVKPTEVDPTLHLELLDKLRAVTADSGGRNLFQFGAPPPPPQAAKLNLPEPVVTPVVQPVIPAAPLPPPPPPPIPLKYYGLSTARANGKKVAFFLDGEIILMAAEGDVLQKRYRVVRIGVNSVTLEDTQLKREQSVPLATDPNG